MNFNIFLSFFYMYVKSYSYNTECITAVQYGIPWIRNILPPVQELLFYTELMSSKISNGVVKSRMNFKFMYTS